MYIYILCLIFILVLYLLLYKFKYTKNSKKIFCISVFIIFTLIQGLRSESVGIDTSKYIKYYLISDRLSWWQVLSKDVLNFEIGFGVLMKTLVTINCQPQVFLIIIAAIINGRNNAFHLQTFKKSLF